MGGDESQRVPNRLIDEASPYLLQHAYNPVQWFPWGDEARARSAAEGRPILLSIGYAACHWCHVMERESFEDPTTAAYMNEHFVCVKVDREERPDVDSIYMDAVQAMTGRGGWPMTVFLTPEGIPFYGGTYFPPEDRHGMPSFRRVMEAVVLAWRDRRDEIEKQGREMIEQIKVQSMPRPSAEPLTRGPLDLAVPKLEAQFDWQHGGFGSAPKFPQPPVLELLVRCADRAGRARDMAELTLRRMALGGIYDQAGGGFHRYSVDREWLVPHFEKMLYDNAQLARVYVHAWQAWHAPLYRRIAEETLEYLLTDLADPAGGFCSSEDADSEGEEGRFYVWSHEEVMAVAPEAVGYYGVTPEGNFEGRTILTAGGDEPPSGARARLLAARAGRVRPARDDKVLASWNGLAVSALAEAGAAFGRADLVEAARRAAAFLLNHLVAGSGRLLHSWKAGRARVPGMLEDHAYLAEGLFTLWEATFEPRWAEACERLCRQMLERFWDPGDGGFYSTASDHEQLIVRQKEVIESVYPSPNAVASLVLQKLSVLTGDDDLRTRGVEVLRLAQPFMERVPQVAPTFLAALDFHVSTPKEVVVVGDRSDPGAAALLGEVWGRFLPNRVLAGAPPGIASPMLEGKEPVDGAPTAFVCESYACRAPTTDPQELARQLK